MWCRIPSCFNARDIARTSGWCRFTCAPALGQMCAWRVSTPTASQQGNLTATCSSIPMNRLPMPTNSAVGMTRSESVGLARRYAVYIKGQLIFRPKAVYYNGSVRALHETGANRYHALKSIEVSSFGGRVERIHFTEFTVCTLRPYPILKGRLFHAHKQPENVF